MYQDPSFYETENTVFVIFRIIQRKPKKTESPNLVIRVTQKTE
jgi:hypothetical protein